MTDVDGRSRLSSDIISEAVAWRRHLHRHPELAYQERMTSDFVAAQLLSAGLNVHRGLAGTGVVGTLTRGTSRRVIGIRADMDALRVCEQTDVPHASNVAGVMHACGHDGHVAIALAAARVCATLPGLDGTVHFIFQPAEEGAAGARRMMDDGLFKLFPCDAVYALHNWPALPVGRCAAPDGPVMAANAVFEIEVIGRGCHAAMPHQGVDSIVAGCQLVSAMQTIISRNIDTAESSILSVTQFHAGGAHNVTPDSCSISGTARWFSEAVGSNLEKRLAALSTSLANAFGCQAKVRFERRYPATINDAKAAAFVRSVVSNSVDLSLAQATPSMGSEDFAYMLQETAGCYIWLGSCSQYNSHGLHSPRFDFNDDAIPKGVALWVAIVEASIS